jgi:two-component system chemotaxis response regulator CheY
MSMSKQILIVDDSATTRLMIKRVLSMCGVESQSVHEAPDGMQALAVLRTRRIDLVLADLHMPNMGGIELTQTMQADATLRDVPTVIISADPNAARLSDLKRQGVRQCLSKPFTPEAFRTALGPLLE